MALRTKEDVIVAVEEYITANPNAAQYQIQAFLARLRDEIGLEPAPEPEPAPGPAPVLPAEEVADEGDANAAQTQGSLEPTLPGTSTPAAAGK